MRDVFKVSIRPEQVKELAQLSNGNHHTEAMKKLTKWVLMGLVKKDEALKSFGEWNMANMDFIIEEAESRFELMSTIEHLHDKFNHLTDTCNDVRYDLMNKTLACITNEEEVRGAL